MNVSGNYRYILTQPEQETSDRRREPPLACVAIQVNKAIHKINSIQIMIYLVAPYRRIISWIATHTLAKTIGYQPYYELSP